jgi:hypothetical protein
MRPVRDITRCLFLGSHLAYRMKGGPGVATGLESACARWAGSRTPWRAPGLALHRHPPPPPYSHRLPLPPPALSPGDTAAHSICCRTAGEREVRWGGEVAGGRWERVSTSVAPSRIGLQRDSLWGRSLGRHQEYVLEGSLVRVAAQLTPETPSLRAPGVVSDARSRAGDPSSGLLLWGRPGTLQRGQPPAHSASTDSQPHSNPFRNPDPQNTSDFILELGGSLAPKTAFGRALALFLQAQI